MKVFLAGANGKKKLLELYDNVLSIRYNEDASALESHHQGMAIVMRGTHLCKTMRGVRSNGQMTVSHLSGLFKTDSEARKEFYKLIDLQE